MSMVTATIADTWTRVDLARYFAALGFTMGAEIGVERGLYAEVLCREIPNLRLLAVDAWTAYSGYREHVTQAKLDAFWAEAQERLAPYGATVVKAFSVEAARHIPDGSLDFVYIDGNHMYDQVWADLTAWVPKVRSGGIVAGHDYGRSSVGHVAEAVDDWCVEHDVLLTVCRGDRSPSWFWVQPDA